VGVVTIVSIAGLPDAVVYFGAKQPEKSGRYCSSAILLAWIIGIPLMGACGWFMSRLLFAQGASVILIARWYLWGFLLIYSFQAMLIATLLGRNILAWNFFQLVPSLAWLFALLLGLF